MSEIYSCLEERGKKLEPAKNSAKNPTSCKGENGKAIQGISQLAYGACCPPAGTNKCQLGPEVPLLWEAAPCLVMQGVVYLGLGSDRRGLGSGFLGHIT